MAVAQDQVIIQIDLEADNAIEVAKGLGDRLQSLKDTQKSLAAQNKSTSVSYVQNKQAITELTREQKNYITLANSETGSNKQLRAQLSLLTAQYDALGKSTRDETTAGKALEVQIASINRELLKSEGSTGRFQRNVGNYSSGVGSSIQSLGSLTPIGGFLPAATALAAPVTNFVKTIGFATEAVKAQQTANELLALSNVAAADSAEKQAVAETATEEAVRARAIAEEKLAVAEAARLELETKLLDIQLADITAQEAEIEILAQYAREQAVVIAEEELRIAQEQALTAVTLELAAAERARAAAETEVASTSAAVAAQNEAAQASMTAFASASTLGLVAVIALIVAAGAAVGKFLFKLDSISDGFEQFKSRAGAAFTEVGRQITESFKNGGALSVLTDFGKTLIGDSEAAERLIERMNGVAKASNAAADSAAKFTEIFQNLQDLTDVNENANQVTQNEVQQLRLQARNRKLSNDEKQALLQQADKIEQDQFDKTKGLHASILAETVEFADKSVSIQGTLNEETAKQYGLTAAELKKQLAEGNMQLANNLLNDDKISREAYKKLKDGYALRNSDLQQANVQLEKIRNDEDKYALQAEQAAAKRAEALQKIAEDRAKALLAIARLGLTTRQYEYEQINLDINKREILYRKYGVSTTILEQERLARITELNRKFYEEDLKQIRANIAEAANIRIGMIGDPIQKQFEQQKQANQQQLQAVIDQELKIVAAVALGDNSQLDELQSFEDKRKALKDQGAVIDQQREDAIRQRDADNKTVRDQAELDEQTAHIQRLQDMADAEIAINEEKLASYDALAGAIGDLFGKQSTLGKIALVAQKAFAIAEIAIQYERAKAAIVAKYAILEAQAATIPVGGEFIIAGLEVAKYAELARTTQMEAIAIITTSAQAIASIVGKAKGGIQYNSDGKGAILPGYSKEDNMNARLRSGEAVIVSEAVQDPHTAKLLSYINKSYGGADFAPGFASGGVYGGSFAQQANADIASQVQNRNELLRIIGSQKIYTAITEINDGQAKYAQITDAGNSL